MPSGRRFIEVADIFAALLLALVGAVAVVALPAGSPVRVVLVVPILALSPGYLLLQAVLVPARPPLSRLFHALLSIGISLAVVGLVALSTALVRGAFKPPVIVTAVTLACVGLAAAGTYRRLYQPEVALRRHARPSPSNPRDRRETDPLIPAPAVVEVPPAPGPQAISVASMPHPDALPITDATIAEPPTPMRSFARERKAR